ncbi:MAG TPA: histidinol phosphate phosphatase [Ruminococcaceae bacterium]|nr:histidinol phosphate phosphatase [Oscillospiraceae bacterium]
MLYNLHTHTKRCNHASGEDREYVEAAIKSGIKTLGFADHCPQFFPVTDYYSRFRMRPELCEDYVNSVRRLQKEYADDINILLGFETEYYPICFDRLIEFIKPFEFDYMIMGQHFVGNEYDERTYYTPRGERGESFLESYVNQVIEGLGTGKFTYIAHPDTVNYSGDLTFYRKQIKRLCDYCKKQDIPLEYNILGHTNNKCYPNPEFWRIAAETGNKTVLGFDAHSPEALKTLGAYNECLTELKELGIAPADFDEIKLLKP